MENPIESLRCQEYKFDKRSNWGLIIYLSRREEYYFKHDNDDMLLSFTIFLHRNSISASVWQGTIPAADEQSRLGAEARFTFVQMIF